MPARRLRELHHLRIVDHARMHAERGLFTRASPGLACTFPGLFPVRRARSRLAFACERWCVAPWCRNRCPWLPCRRRGYPDRSRPFLPPGVRYAQRSPGAAPLRTSLPAPRRYCDRAHDITWRRLPLRRPYTLFFICEEPSLGLGPRACAFVEHQEIFVMLANMPPELRDFLGG